ncbi:MAG: GNAT family N-acetyltransferase [Bacteroidaceae bacterium]|nr:GNAT family N-acetyltransferase [Bacteroidaceae bacterium]
MDSVFPALSFRAPEPEDLDFLYRIENDTAVWPISECMMPYSRYALREYIAKCNTDFFAEKQLRLMVEMEGERQPVAIVDLFDFHPLDGRAELGVIVDPTFRNRGIGERAVAMLCEYASKVLGLRMLAGTVLRDNDWSCNMLLKNGFLRVATLPEWVVVKGKACDLDVFQKKM